MEKGQSLPINGVTTEQPYTKEKEKGFISIVNTSRQAQYRLVYMDIV